MSNADTMLIIQALQQLPNFGTVLVELPDFLYAHLSQCVLSAIYSIGSNAESERNVVLRYSVYAGLTMNRPARDTLPAIAHQQPLDQFVNHIDLFGPKAFAEQILQNSQLTSTINGILKAEAVADFARVLLHYDIHYLQDVDPWVGDPDFERDIQAIKGQQYRTSLYYFYMVVSREDYIKPDRMVLAFLSRALGRIVKKKEVQRLLAPVTTTLQQQYPQITTRMIDNAIWMNERRSHHTHG